MKPYTIVILLSIVTACISRPANEKQIEIMEKNGIELDPILVQQLYRTEQWTPDNPSLNFVKIKELTADLNGNGKQDSISLYILDAMGDDPGDFHQIRITSDDGHTWTETNFDGWVRFDYNYSVPDQVKSINRLETDLLLLTEFGDTIILGLFGWVYANEPGLLTIIEFSTGKPRLMINQQLDLVSLDRNRITTKYLEDQCWTELRNNRIVMTCE